ncbi:MAG: hypothetical protein GX162_07435 [Firmicutes bacterium]|nr:hypothetical protein [Bacillota bacterium]
MLDIDKKPLQPTHTSRARILLERDKTAVYRRYPFTIVVEYAVDDPADPDLCLKTVRAAALPAWPPTIRCESTMIIAKAIRRGRTISGTPRTVQAGTLSLSASAGQSPEGYVTRAIHDRRTFLM